MVKHAKKMAAPENASIARKTVLLVTHNWTLFGRRSLYVIVYIDILESEDDQQATSRRVDDPGSRSNPAFEPKDILMVRPTSE